MTGTRKPFEARIVIQAWAMDEPGIVSKLDREFSQLREDILNAHRVWHEMLDEGLTPQGDLAFAKRVDPRAE